MNEPAHNMDVGRIAAVIARRWKTVLALVILTTMAAYAYVTFMAKPVYESTALVTYQAPDRSTNPTGGALPVTGVTREEIGTLVANATSPTVVDKAAVIAGIPAEQLRRQVRVQAYGEASIVAFIARDGDPATAAAYANAWAKAFVDDRRGAVSKVLTAEVKRATRAVAQSTADVAKQPKDARDYSARTAAVTDLQSAQSNLNLWTAAISVSNQAQAPDAAVWPKKTLTLIAALLAGLGIGSGVALLTARVDNRLRLDDVDLLPTAVMGRVPVSPRAPKNAPLGPTNAEPIVADSFAALGSRALLDRMGDGAHVILVTSARSGEGKSSVASNLASALALGGRRVVLVDADMRRPTQDVVFPMLQGKPGLSQVLTRASDLESALTLVAPNLAVVGSGPRHSNASMLLASVAMRQLVERLAEISEVIVIDAPPVLAVNDALAIAPAADQVLHVARVGSSDMQELIETNARLATAAQTPQAIVLVGTDRPEGYGYDKELQALAKVPNAAPQAQPGMRPTAPRPEPAAPAAPTGTARPDSSMPPAAPPPRQAVVGAGPVPSPAPAPPSSPPHAAPGVAPNAMPPMRDAVLPSVNPSMRAPSGPPVPPSHPGQGAVA